MSLPVLPPNSTYDRLMRGYFGDRTTDDKNTLWQAFLQQEGLTSNPTETPELLARYSTYIDSLYEAQQAMAAAAGDPRLQMLWSIYDILILLISKFVKCQINNQSAVEFLTRYQKAYQDEMSRVFFYIGAPAVSGTDRNDILSQTPDGIRTPTAQTPSNIDTFKLGYGNLTIAEYVDWLYRKASENSAGTPYSLTIAGKPIVPVGNISWYADLQGQPNTTITVTRDANNNYTISVNSHVEMFEKWWGWIDRKTLLDQNFPQTATISIPSSADYGNFMAKAEELFQASYNQAQSALQARDRSFELYTPWENNILLNYTGPTDEIKSDYAKEVKFRSERNRNIQSCIDAIKSRKDVVGDKADQQQRLIDSSSSGRKQSSNIMQTIIRQMQTILGSIFRG